MKICTKCKIEQELTEFYKDINQSCGLRPNCKTCCRKVNNSNKLNKKEESREYNKKERKRRKFDLDYRFIHARSKAKNKGKSKGYSWSITFEEYTTIILMGCHYCHSNLLKETGIGLDRMDNNKGYVLDNVLPCCGTCNRIRQDLLKVQEMEVAMKAILAYRADTY